MNPYASVGAVLVLLAMWLTGNRNPLGFLVGAIAEAFWLLYSIRIHCFELGFLSVIFVCVYLRNYAKWMNHDR